VAAVPANVNATQFAHPPVRLPRFFDTKTVAGILGLSRQTIYWLVKQGRLPAPAARDGKRLLWTLDQWPEIEANLRSREPPVPRKECFPGCTPVERQGYCEPWWRLWNRQFGTSLTADDAKRLGAAYRNLRNAGAET
jgi:excisionase family DNA binding protein